MSAPRVAPLRMEPWLIDDIQQWHEDRRPMWAGFHPDYPHEAKWFTCPYGAPGDRLWVRETWQARSPADLEWTIYKPSERPGYRPDQWRVRYAATDENFSEYSGWNPSIHMPRWASRIALEVVSIRVERVQSISEADAEAEGVDRIPQAPAATNHRTAFAGLWNSINAKRGYGWDANPYVWVVEFEAVQS